MSLLADLHVDFPANMHWLRQLPLCSDAVLIVAGDVTHSLEQLAETFKILRPLFRAVCYVPGNQ